MDDEQQATDEGDEAGLTFDDAGGLAAWLVAGGVPLHEWGRGNSKTVAELWAEARAGETALHADPPRRVVAVAQVIIRRGGRVLTEIEQEMADGRRRRRNAPPSEKLKGGESPLGAAQRCLAEELAVAVHLAALCEEEQPHFITLNSPSYLGLPTTYRIHTVTAAAGDLPGAPLPDADFWRDNAAASDPIRRHLWGWR